MGHFDIVDVFQKDVTRKGIYRHIGAIIKAAGHNFHRYKLQATRITFEDYFQEVLYHIIRRKNNLRGKHIVRKIYYYAQTVAFYMVRQQAGPMRLPLSPEAPCDIYNLYYEGDYDFDRRYALHTQEDEEYLDETFIFNNEKEREFFIRLMGGEDIKTIAKSEGVDNRKFSKKLKTIYNRRMRV